MTPLDMLIAAAMERTAARAAAAERAAQERHEEARRQQMSQLDREMRRALPADVIAALDGQLDTQHVYPQCFYQFTVGTVGLRLWYGEERNARSWHLVRADVGERDHCGCVVEEQVYADTGLFVDRLLCAIGELASPHVSVEAF